MAASRLIIFSLYHALHREINKTLFTLKPRRANLIRHTLVKDYKHSSRDDWRDKTRGGHDGLHVIYAEICYLCNI